MKAVILDGFTLNPGDIGWGDLENVCDFTIHDRTDAADVVERSKNAEIILTNKTPISGADMQRLPALKYICVLATGYNVIDVKAAKNRGIIVANIPAYGTPAVAQMTFALLLELCHHVQRHSDTVKDGDWSRGPDFCYWNYPLIELIEKTIGIIGFGKIGQNVSRIATAFGMKVIAYDQVRFDVKSIEFEWVDIDAIFRKSDVLSLHCPLFPETEKIVNKKNIDKMKKSAFLINTSRGALVNDFDLADALNNEIIAGAALDVLSDREPPDINNPLMKTKNCIITPHISWAAKEARIRLLDIAIKNVKSYLNGVPINTVT